MNPYITAAALTTIFATRHAARAYWAGRARTWAQDRADRAEELAYWATIRGAQ